MIHVIPRSALPEDGVVSFEHDASLYLLADLEGEIRGFEVTGPAASEVSRAIVADGKIRCPMHGWPIDPEEGRCGASELCRYRPLQVEVSADQIRVLVD
jgi:nitrite reductase/ring-hydroxylating ferredoxin subunit